MSDQLTLQEVCEKYWPEDCPFFDGFITIPHFAGPGSAIPLYPEKEEERKLLDRWLPIIAATAWAWWKMKQVASIGDQNADWDYAYEAALAWASLIRWEAAQ